MSGYLLTDMYVVVCGWLKGHHIFHGGELLNPDFIGAYHGTLHTHTHTQDKASYKSLFHVPSPEYIICKPESNLP
jgi:hypothetical protein